MAPKPLRPPPLPECPPGANPFAWIARTAPAVRHARRIAAAQYRMEHQDARDEEARPVSRPGQAKG